MRIEVIDNFLFEEDFNYLKNIKLDKIEDDQIKIYSNKIDKMGNILNTCLNYEIIKRLQKNYHLKLIEILEKLFPKKKDLYDYSEFFIVKTGKNYKFPIHDNIPEKLLSGVVYLSPKINTGTIFYENKKGDGKKIIEWKQNRAIFFARKEQETWHSYEGDGVSSRVALVYNLMTKRIKEVYKVENKNFFLSKLKRKLNL